MKKLTLLLFLFLFFACSPTEPEPANTPNLRILSAVENTLVNSSNEFAFALFNQTQNNESNYFLSPLSVGLALGMTLNGAEGETKQGILNTIQFGNLTDAEVNNGYTDLTKLLSGMDRTVNLNIANSVWYKQELSIKSDFKSVIEASYNGTVQGLDFSSPNSKNIINGWIEDHTNNKIKDVIQDIDPNLVMFLINAIYFKGDWTYQFDKTKTKDGNFYLEDGNTVQTIMMQAEKANVSIFSHEKFNLINIPFGNKQFEFSVLLPNNQYTTEDIIPELSADALSGWISSSSEQTVELRMPKFKMKWKKTLNEDLSALGMARAFTPGYAEFPNFFENPMPLNIDFVDHHSFLEVNETGAEASAVTVVGVVYTTSIIPRPRTIIINKPFVFLIREKHSGAILFIGQLKNPLLLQQ
ncbi:MAG TPA: serpin family protein [Cyclobacteriaceae bacterium]|nr:serpin family protein [Cyclobacteriaceae bacterium]